MYKSLLVLIGLVLCIGSLQAQQSSLDQLLQSIAANNKTLVAYRSHIDGESWQYKSKNKLPDPQASAYYLPFGEHNTGDYTEFEISQQFEFPTVYAARDNWIDEQEKRLEYEYQKLRQAVLLKAQKLGLELIYLQKQRQLVQERVNQSKKVNDQIQTLFDKGQTGILDRNKARIIWLDQQFALEELDTRENSIKQELQSLNGGNEVNLQMSTYPNTIEIPVSDSLWNERLNRDAQIALLEQQKKVAQQKLKVERNLLLPDITAGYNYQGVSGSNYSGFYGGISIPLWSGRSNVKVAKAQVDYYDQYQSELMTSFKGTFISQIQRYQMLLNKFREYERAMNGLNSEMLLQKSYELGEISFMDYYREVSFYREAENRMLEIEKEIQQLRAELLKHQL
ncbi:MAG TPA: TolC family protein [Cryomorphaceae bacterium]|nr:transporter [Owenweeksia sp.]MBF97856.1 transporter [Owenweeksia sp.]HAD97376.1 TolC family protein [Cryomorphaceae bacterium]HBF21498.1 TolC family protein [Cryomorphaceae bacterium]|tara:strand:+ start:792 stop:1976 length:1185 start_codon:yes stop_codon:yes gene_type:complete